MDQVRETESPLTVKRPAAPSLLKNLSRVQIAHIANTVYDLDLVVSPNVKKPNMINDVAAAMLAVAGCGPCHPDVHKFGPELFLSLIHI